MLTVTSTAIEAAKIVTPKSFADSRGVFCEPHNRNRFFEHGIALEFIQDNHSSSIEAGTIRGFAFQSPQRRRKINPCASLQHHRCGS